MNSFPMVEQCTARQQEPEIPVRDLIRAGYTEAVEDADNWMCLPHGMLMVESGPYDAEGVHSLPPKPLVCLKVARWGKAPDFFRWGPK